VTRGVTRGLALLPLAVTLGCTPATIHRYQQSPVKGKILGGSEESLVLEDQWGERIIPRQDITDIDHPGTGLEIWGALLAVAGSVFFYERRGDCSHIDQVTCVRLMLPAFAGLTFFFWGAEEYRRSEAATADRSMVLGPRPKRRRPVATGTVIRAPSPVEPPSATTPAGDASAGEPTPDGGQADPPPP